MSFSLYRKNIKETCNLSVSFLDYYLQDTVTCTSRYEMPTSQRNLQHKVTFLELTSADGVVALTSGNYSACGFQLLLGRKRSQLIFQIYLPCILFVCVSWTSFLIRPEVVPGRMALLVTLFLVLINIFNTVRSNAPSQLSRSLNAIDLYIVGSIIMVFFALFEYAIILWSMNHQDSVEIARKKQQ